MSTDYSSYYAGALPMDVPHTKDGYADYSSYYQTHGTYSVSPPESENVSSASGVASYSSPGYSTAASYAGSSHGDNETAVSASGVDFNEYLHDRFTESFDPIPLDKCTVAQAQASGALNNKHQELLELQKKAQARLAKSRARFDQGLQDAREVHADLEWTQKKVSSLKAKASKKHSKEYKKARERYPSPGY